MTTPKVSIQKANKGNKVFQSLGTVERALKNIFPTLIIVSAILYFMLLILSGFAAKPKMSYGLFNRSISDVSAMYPLNITPAGWTFSIWGIIYLSQIASVLYSLALLCRQTDKGPAYLHPSVLSPVFYLFFNFSSIFVISWLFRWTNMLLVSSSIFLLCCVVCLWMAFSIASDRLAFFRSELIDSGRSLDVKVLTISVLNGLGMYATWSTIATLINCGVVLVYTMGSPLSNETASIVCLSCLALFVVLYSCLDMTVFERINRYTFTPYLTIIWALAGVINRNWDSTKVSSIMAAVLLGCDAVALIVKIGLTIARHMSNQNPYRRMKTANPMN